MGSANSARAGLSCAKIIFRGAGFCQLFTKDNATKTRFFPLVKPKAKFVALTSTPNKRNFGFFQKSHRQAGECPLARMLDFLQYVRLKPQF